MELNSETEKFKRSELPEKYTARILFGWDNNKFENKYLNKLEKNWVRWKKKKIKEEEASFSGDRTLREGYYYNMLGY